MEDQLNEIYIAINALDEMIMSLPLHDGVKQQITPARMPGPNRDLEVTLNSAFTTARGKRHEYMTVEHLLLSLLDNDVAVDVLLHCGADLARLRAGLVDYIDTTTPLVADQEDTQDTQPTQGFQRVLQRAVFHVQSSGRQEVTGANVLVAIFSEQESQAVYLLSQQDIARLDVVNYISHGISRHASDRSRSVNRRMLKAKRPKESKPC